MASGYPVRRAGTVPPMSKLVCPKCESPMKRKKESFLSDFLDF